MTSTNRSFRHLSSRGRMGLPPSTSWLRRLALAGAAAACGIALAPQALAASAPAANPARTGATGTPLAVSPSIRLSVSIGTPTQKVTVSGRGFGAREGVDIFFDTADQATVRTGDTGSFGGITFRVPAWALPGRQWISAEGRKTGSFAQRPFTVDTPWAQAGRVAGHTGDNPFENVLNPTDVPGLDEAWAFETGGSGSSSSPAVVDGVVYEASGNGSVYALKASSGAQLWSYNTGSAISSSPAVAAGMVYADSHGGDIYALNAATGVLQWTFATGSPVVSSPAVAGGDVYVGSTNGTLYALNAATGKMVWSFNAGDGSGIESSPAVAFGAVYVGSHDGNVYARNADTGAKLWRFNTGGPIEDSPAVAGGAVYIGSDSGKVYALNRHTGSKIWAFSRLDHFISSPAVAAGVVYIGSLGLSGFPGVYALSAARGHNLWFAQTGVPVTAPPAVAAGVVYIGWGANLFAYDAATGNRLWNANTAGIVRSGAAVANGNVYVESDDGTIIAYNLDADAMAQPRPSRSALHPTA